MLIIGHRGAKGLAPENTLASIQSALDAHVAMIEIDVRVSADGTPVLHHDKAMITSSGKKLRISKTDFTTLQLAKPDLLTLEAALQFIDRRTDVIIEVKPGEPVAPIAACIEPRIMKKWIESDFLFASFDFKILQALHSQFPKVPIAVSEKWSGVRATHRAKKLGTKRIIMNHKWLWSGFVYAITKRGYKLTVYTLNNPKRAKRLEKYGLYGCITDHPQKFMTGYRVT
jgi:glycerophosphoryl diester phosphodiesterase